jgi:hypothetical protein
MITACQQPPPPAPTVAFAEAARPGVTLARGSERAGLVEGRRVEDGSELSTPEAARASLRLDGGGWALLDAKSRVKVGAAALEVAAGRVWIDARAGAEVAVEVPGGTLTATQAGFAVEVAPDGAARAYCVSGQLTYAARTSNRLEAGMAVAIGRDGGAAESPEAQWDDWTGGLAEPGPPRALEPAGVGLLAARRSDELGAARAPLIVRRHDVRATIDGDRVIADVEQVFFNPRSEVVDGLYTLRLPPGAIPVAFEVQPGDGISPGVMQAIGPTVVPIGRRGAGAPGVALEWAGGERYRARVPSLQPGKTVAVRIRWVEWLARRGARRTWVYPMGGGNPPLLGELSLEVDTQRAGAGALEAGMGARVEGHKVVLRKSDFRPRADFALDLLDKKGERDAGPALYVEKQTIPREVGDGYALVQLDSSQLVGAAPESLDLVIVVDVSAGTDPGRLDLERAVVDAIFRQLTPKDRVSLLAASQEAVSLDPDRAATPRPLDAARAEALLERLARTPAGGATDLGAALSTAARALPDGRGAIVYIGDGRPTMGALTVAALEEAMARLGTLPRVFGVAVGADARLDVIGALTGRRGATGAGAGAFDDHAVVLRVEDKPEAAQAAYRLLAAAALPTARDVTVDLGPTVDVAYPTGRMTAVAGAPLMVVGRLRGAPPQKVTVRGRRDGKPFSIDIKLRPGAAEARGDLARRWAAGRLADLLARGAGREALIEVGTRFGLVTPYSAMITVSGGRIPTYRPIEAPEAAGLGEWAPERERDRDEAPLDGPIALPAGTSSTLIARSDLGAMYARLLEQRDEGPRACFDRRAASRPELGGRLEVKVKIGLAGEVQQAALASSTVRDAELGECVLRAVKAQRLPPPPDGKIREVVAAFTFEAEDARLGAGRKCSPASAQYLSSRRALWRERLASNPGVDGAMAVWREAERACELKSWLDKKALVDLLRVHVGRTREQVDLYHRFDGKPDVQAHLRREILAHVRTAADLQALRAGLSLDGGIAADLLEAQLKRAPDDAARIHLVKQYLAFAPDGIALRVRLLDLLSSAAAAKRPEADRHAREALQVADGLRADPAADLRARQAVGEALSRFAPDEGLRAFGEIVEFAPFDPTARRTLGDLYLAYGRFEEAAREYAALAWLTPGDPTALLRLARAEAGAGRVDEALRLEERVAEATAGRSAGRDPSSWARAAHALRLAQLRAQARDKRDAALAAGLAARARSSGLHAWATPLFAAVTARHPDRPLELSLVGPGDTVPRRAEVQGGEIGIEAARLARPPKGPLKLQVRCPRCAPGAAWSGDLWVVLDELGGGERLLHAAVAPGADEITLSDGALSGGKIASAK